MGRETVHRPLVSKPVVHHSAAVEKVAQAGARLQVMKERVCQLHVGKTVRK